ncbi:MAG TPA: cell division protein CrgA [Acidimicrobiales bacterium]|nr:cell division protein CrgA [Acidimicrobiales bacterium]
MAKPTPQQHNRKTVGRYVSPESRGKVTVRHTPEEHHSPSWYGWLIIDLLAFGMMVITLNYLQVLPGAVSSWYLLLGLLTMFGGFFLATRYH